MWLNLTFTFCFLEELKSYFDKFLYDGIINRLLDFMIKYMEQYEKTITPIVLKLLGPVYYHSVLIPLLNIVDFLQNTIGVFSGSNMVTYKGEKKYLLDLLFGYGPIRKTFFAITMIGIVLTVIFTLFSVIRSMGDLSGDPKKSVGKVLGSLGRTMLTFLLVPAIVTFGISLSSIALRQTEAMIGNGTTSLANIIFVSTTMSAAKDESMNGDNASYSDSIRNKYLTGGKLYYTNNILVAEDFDYAKIGYGSGAISAIFIIVMLFLTSYSFIRRMLDLVILYIVSPIYVAFIPLDEGKKFGAWREMFVARALSGFGIVIIMQLYLIMTPLIMSPSVQFHTSSLASNLIRLLFVLGASYAAYKGQMLIMQIINPAVARMEQEGLSTMQGIASGAVTMGVQIAKTAVKTTLDVGKLAGSLATGVPMGGSSGGEEDS